MNNENSKTKQLFTIDSIKERLNNDRKRFEKEPERLMWYSKSDKIKRIDLLLDALDNLEHYLNDPIHYDKNLAIQNSVSNLSKEEMEHLQECSWYSYVYDVGLILLPNGSFWDCPVPCEAMKFLDELGLQEK